jgi:hypothetical protein
MQPEAAYSNPPRPQSANPTHPVKFNAAFLDQRMRQHRNLLAAVEYEEVLAIVREVELGILSKLLAAQEEAKRLEVAQ